MAVRARLAVVYCFGTRRMVSPAIEQELRGYLERIPAARQREVIDFARTLAASPDHRPSSGPDLDRFVGAIDPADLALMSQVIDDGCERVNPSDWA